MKIRSVNTTLLAGDFMARVKDGELCLPEEFVGLLPQLHAHVDSAETLISRLVSFPSEFATVLGWNVDNVKKATVGLQKCCQRHLPAGWEPPFSPSYGALSGNNT